MLHKNQKNIEKSGVEKSALQNSADENSEDEQIVSRSDNIILKLCINLESPESLRRSNRKQSLDKTFEIRQETTIFSIF